MEDEKEKELLCFRGKGITYAVEFSEVAEICVQMKLEEIPCLPEYFCGIGHYKGRVISVVGMEKIPDKKPGDVVLMVNAGEYLYGICIEGEPWICPPGRKPIEDTSKSMVSGVWREKALYYTDSEVICLLDLTKSAQELAALV